MCMIDVADQNVGKIATELGHIRGILHCVESGYQILNVLPQELVVFVSSTPCCGNLDVWELVQC